MSVDSKAEIRIERPKGIVAAFIFDPKNDPLWIVGVNKCFPQTAGLMAKGSKFERNGTLVGKGYSTTYLVVRDEPGEFVEMTAEDPFQMKIRYDLAEDGDSTSVRIRLQAFGDLNLQRSASAVEKAVTESLNADLKKLKSYIENNLN
ncbi:MAG: SRPBCC family protein [Blastocatellia bacterium]|nr:SRPBCC family protein [Blastocatellia bacterium]